jgi:hypothetical protein
MSIDSIKPLLAKYSELLTGDATDAVTEKVMVWALYSQMKKTMPALIQHWHHDNPETKEEIKKLFEEIQALNQAHKAQRANQNDHNQ